MPGAGTGIHASQNSPVGWFRPELMGRHLVHQRRRGWQLGGNLHQQQLLWRLHKIQCQHFSSWMRPVCPEGVPVHPQGKIKSVWNINIISERFLIVLFLEEKKEPVCQSSQLFPTCLQFSGCKRVWIFFKPIFNVFETIFLWVFSLANFPWNFHRRL